MKFLEWIKSLFAKGSYQDQLEQYIASKFPTSAAEVEHWTREYSYKKERGWT